MTTCTITGFACNCQPDEGVPCNGLAELRKAYAEWRTKAEQLRGNLTLAEEGLANYAQEVEHLRAYQLQMNDILKDNERLRSTLAHRLQELYDAKWLIRNGEKHFGSLWREATTDDILAITRRAEPQSPPQSEV